MSGDFSAGRADGIVGKVCAAGGTGFDERLGCGSGGVWHRKPEEHEDDADEQQRPGVEDAEVKIERESKNEHNHA